MRKFNNYSLARMIIKLLKQDRAWADDDHLLCNEIWRQEAVMHNIGQYRNMNFLECCMYVRKEQFSKFTSIERVRRLIEEHRPHLRGYTYDERQRKGSQGPDLDPNQMGLFG